MDQISLPEVAELKQTGVEIMEKKSLVTSPWYWNIQNIENIAANLFGLMWFSLFTEF